MTSGGEGLPRPATDEELALLEQQAPRFELPALLKTLAAYGFTFEQIRFEGVRELVPPRGSLVRGLKIERRPVSRAVIALNAGLLAHGSPLPEYFRAFARRLDNPAPMIDFLGFLDSILLRDLVACSFPVLTSQSKRGLLPGYQARLRGATPMSLHWFFRSLFPELPVTVHHARFFRRAGVDSLRVGSRLDGTEALGGSYGERLPGFRVRLRADQARGEGVSDWEARAMARLKEREDDLRRLDKPIEVVLRFDAYLHGQSLVASSDERRQLGVRPWLYPSPSDPQRAEPYGPGEVLLREPWAYCGDVRA